MENYFDLNSKIYKGTKSLDDKFEIFAKFILSECVLYINKDKYYIEEIEFYYYDDLHKDSYVHQMQDQKTSCEWYHHKYKTGVYKSGTYKGLDLTFGNNSAFGGILIRALVNANTNEYIIGPCNVVNHILKSLNYSDVNELVSNMKDKNAFSNVNPFYIKKEKSIDTEIFKGPRVGLSGKYPQYMFLNYRFLKSPSNTLKYKDTLVSVLYKNGMSPDEIFIKTGIKKPQILKAIYTYEHGKTLDNVIGEKNINTLFGFYSK